MYRVGVYTDIEFHELSSELQAQLPLSTFQHLQPDEQPPGCNKPTPSVPDDDDDSNGAGAAEEEEEYQSDEDTEQPNEQPLDCIMIGYYKFGGVIPLTPEVLGTLRHYLDDGGNIVLFGLSVFNDGSTFELGTLKFPLLRAPYDESTVHSGYEIYMDNHVLLQGVSDWQQFQFHNVCGCTPQCDIVAAYTVDQSPLVAYTKKPGNRIAIANVLPLKCHISSGVDIDEEEYEATTTLLGNSISFMCLKMEGEVGRSNGETDDPAVNELLEKSKTLSNATEVQFFRLDADGEVVEFEGNPQIPHSDYLLQLCVDNVEIRRAPHCMYVPLCDYNFDDEEYVWAVLEATRPGSAKQFTERDEMRIISVRGDPVLRNLHSFRPPPATKDSTSGGGFSLLSVVKQAQRRASRAFNLPDRTGPTGTEPEEDSPVVVPRSRSKSVVAMPDVNTGGPLLRKRDRGVEFGIAKNDYDDSIGKLTVTFKTNEAEDRYLRRLQRSAIADDDEPVVPRNTTPTPLSPARKGISTRKTLGLEDLLSWNSLSSLH